MRRQNGLRCWNSQYLSLTETKMKRPSRVMLNKMEKMMLQAGKSLMHFIWMNLDLLLVFLLFFFGFMGIEGCLIHQTSFLKNVFLKKTALKICLIGSQWETYRKKRWQFILRIIRLTLTQVLVRE